MKTRSSRSSARGSGQEALAKTLDHDFFMILLDVQMPGMDGYEVAELLRGSRRTRNIPIIFITANYSGEEQLFRGYDAGAVDYLIKPVAPRILLGKISVFKTLFRQQRELVRKTEELNGTISELEELHKELGEKNEQLRILSNMDGLTGLYNRRFFNNLIEEEWCRGSRAASPLSLVMGDVDHFKLYNDTYGHIAGDNCLKEVSALFRRVFRRRVDRVARYGGEEIIAVLPETDSDGARRLAGLLLDEVRSAAIEHKASENGRILTLSLGVCTVVPSAESSPLELVKAVDSALYDAKNNGRDRFEVREVRAPES